MENFRKESSRVLGNTARDCLCRFVSVCLVSSNKIPQTTRPKKQKFYFLQSLEAESLRSRCQKVSFSSDASFLAWQWKPSHCMDVCKGLFLPVVVGDVCVHGEWGCVGGWDIQRECSLMAYFLTRGLSSGFMTSFNFNYFHINYFQIQSC